MGKYPHCCDSTSVKLCQYELRLQAKGLALLQCKFLMNICSGCRAFSESCSKAQEPEDVTVGLIVGEAILAIHSPVSFP